MTEAVTVVLHNAQQGHAQLQTAWRDVLKPHLMAGRQMVCEIKSLEESRSAAANRYYWGVFLPEISEQARVGGQRYTVDAWHEFGKRQFLPRKTKKVHVAGRARPVVSTVLGSTTELSARRFTEYLEKYRAYAVADLGVVFSEEFR